MTAETKLTVHSPADLVAALPYLIGFHPADSIAVLALRRGRMIFAGRQDLPPPDEAPADARYLAWVARRQDADAAAIIGYGEPARVTPAVLATEEALLGVGIRVLDLIRVTGDRFWSYRDEDCPADGWPLPPEDTAVAAIATYAGQVALPDRATLVSRLDPVTGDERAAMGAATVRAQERLAGLVSKRESDPGRPIRRAGRTAVRDAERRYRAGGRLLDDEVAWLGILLADPEVRDYAWERAGEVGWAVSLWTDVLRRVEPAYVPAPASLLAFVAWRAGMGALALIAVDRATDEDPEYAMAKLMADVLAAGIPPSALDGWPMLDRAEHAGSTGSRPSRYRPAGAVRIRR